MKFQFFDNRTHSTKKIFPQTDQASISCLDRGYLFGDGFFTTAIIHQGGLKHLQYHLSRLSDSALRLDFNGFDIDELSQELTSFIKTIDIAILRITVSREQSNRGYAYTDHDQINITFLLSDLNDPPADYCQLDFAVTPITVNKMFAGIKHLNRLDNIFAAKEINSINQERLLCDDNWVISGSRTNLFIYENGCWLTPKINTSGVNGVTRQRLLKMMQTQNINYLEANISRQQVINCQAAFVTNSLLGMWIVDTINSNKIDTFFSKKLKNELNFEP